MNYWDDMKQGFLDLDDVSREQSNVSAETYEKLHQIVAATIEAEGDDTRLFAKHVVEELSPAELEAIVEDWLEGRGHLGAP